MHTDPCTAKEFIIQHRNYLDNRAAVGAEQNLEQPAFRESRLHKILHKEIIVLE